MKKWEVTYTKDFGDTYQTTEVDAESYTMAMVEVWGLGFITDLKEI